MPGAPPAASARCAPIAATTAMIANPADSHGTLDAPSWVVAAAAAKPASAPPPVIAAPARGNIRRASRPATLAATVFHKATLATDASVVVVSVTTNGHAPPWAISVGATAAAAVSPSPSATSTVADGARPVIAS